MPFGRIILPVLLLALGCTPMNATPLPDAPWNPDLGSEFRNPVLFSDYSDPDVIRVGDEFFLTASSFSDSPGLPLLRSKDLVNWRLVGHALPRLSYADFSKPRHGRGVWAPSIRHHDGWFWIFFPDPDLGIFMVKSRKIEGPWTAPHRVIAASGWIDPCPLWLPDGSAWLVNGFAASRAGINAVLLVTRMKPDGTALIDEAGKELTDLPGKKSLVAEPGTDAWAGKERLALVDDRGNRFPGAIVYDGRVVDPVIEGPKFYARKGFFYLFAPAGSVQGGWQVVLRSKHPTGPYERSVTLRQGSTDVNGPHQGAWVDTPKGEDWFLHFQDREAYGRVVHLNPMRWKADGWCEMGGERLPDGSGEPLVTGRKPSGLPAPAPGDRPLKPGDDFLSKSLSLEWQWPCDPAPDAAGRWFKLDGSGKLVMPCQSENATGANLFASPSVLAQKFPAPQFHVTTTVRLSGASANARAGLLVNGMNHAWIALASDGKGFFLRRGGAENKHVGKGIVEYGKDEATAEVPFPQGVATIRVSIEHRIREAIATFSWLDADGTTWRELGKPFPVKAGLWIGAKFGLFSGGDSGEASFDAVRVSRR